MDSSSIPSLSKVPLEQFDHYGYQYAELTSAKPPTLRFSELAFPVKLFRQQVAFFRAEAVSVGNEIGADQRRVLLRPKLDLL